MSPDVYALSDRAVLVTGGAGYIGSHTVLALLRTGARVVVLDNFDNASPVALTRVAELAGVGAGDGRLGVVEVDLRDRAATRDAVLASGASAVVHFAGRKAVGESVEHPVRYYDHNVVGTVNLVAAMEEAGIGDLVFSSSATVYGDPATVPVTESAAVRPVNPYGRTKSVVEGLLADVAASGPAWRILLLRYFNPVGADPSGRIGEDPTGTPDNLMPFVMQVAVGRRSRLAVFGNDYDTPDGTCIRDYVHVVDLADAHLAALVALDRIGGVRAVNVGTGTGSSVLEVVAAAGRAVGHPIPYEVTGRRPGDVARVFADTSLAADLLGWRASRDLDDMCRDHWSWQHANPNGYPSD